MKRRGARRGGVTLLELLTTLVLLGILGAVTTLAIRQMDRPSPTDPSQIVADSVRSVMARGQSAQIRVLVGRIPAHAFVGLDGMVFADSAFGVDVLTGMPSRAR
ncbi:MAG TPA: prepilin-type N-terminal cleavage/methylation domain-containing protein [Gemmatimonadaceae bacterium]|nr:prepilin-type N-terminal cleavage/methylation domain-containing protein [Gemmatimonadaceae bacterium]